MNIHQVTSREKHGKKVWYFRWDDPISGKRREISARTRREANLKRNTLITRAEDGSMPISKGKAKVTDVVRSYLDDRRQGLKMPRVSDGHLANLDVYMRPWSAWPDRPIAAITSDDLKLALRDLPYTNKTRRNYLFAWTAFAAWLVTEKYRLDKITDGIKLESSQAAEMWIPSEDSVRTLVTEADGQWKPVIATLAMCGLRAGELRALPWENVSLNGGYIRVTQAVKKNGVIGAPKTQKSIREIPLPGFVGAMYSELPRNGDLVFPGSDGRQMSPDDLWSGVRKVIKRSGVEWRHQLHVFRHFTASRMIDLGWTPKRIQVALGHSAHDITMDRYGHLIQRKSFHDEGEEMAHGYA